MRKIYTWTLGLLVLLSLAIGTSVADAKAVDTVGIAHAQWYDQESGYYAMIDVESLEIENEVSSHTVLAMVAIRTDTGYNYYYTNDGSGEASYINISRKDFVIYDINSPKLLTKIPVTVEIHNFENELQDTDNVTLKLNIVWTNTEDRVTAPIMFDPSIPYIVRGVEAYENCTATGSIRGDITTINLGITEYWDAFYIAGFIIDPKNLSP